MFVLFSSDKFGGNVQTKLLQIPSIATIFSYPFNKYYQGVGTANLGRKQCLVLLHFQSSHCQIKFYLVVFDIFAGR